MYLDDASIAVKISVKESFCQCFGLTEQGEDKYEENYKWTF